MRDPHPLSFRSGRFVFFDGRNTSAAKVRSLLTAEHRAIDIDLLRRDWPFDPFEALIDDRASFAAWRVGDRDLIERVARRPKALIRRRLIARLRDEVARAGGLWARIAPYPRPYRAAFGFRADLDEPHPDDFACFARAEGRSTTVRPTLFRPPPTVAIAPCSTPCADSTSNRTAIFTSFIAIRNPIDATLRAPRDPRRSRFRSGGIRRARRSLEPRTR